MTYNNKTKTIAICVLVLSISITSIALAIQPTNAAPADNPVTQQNMISDNTEIVKPKRGLSIDDKFAEIEDVVPGFSGLFFDDQGKLNVYVKDSQKTTSKQTALALGKYLDADSFENGVNVLPTEHNWKQFLGWKNSLRSLPAKDLGISLLDIDEKNQEIDIGLVKYNTTSISQIKKFLEANNIPQEIVRFEETGTTILESHGVTVSPMKGGAELGVVGHPNNPCSSSFIADKVSNGLRVIVTAGHCELTVDPSADQTYTNPNGGSVIGAEISGNFNGPRNSDSLLIGPSTSTSLGKIYKNGSTLTILGKTYIQSVGTNLCKYGKTTHETCGNIQRTAVDVTDHPYYGTVWDQNTINFNSGNGDSGSPVYKYETGSTTLVRLYGLHWGVLGTGEKAYSPIGQIEADQGTLTVN